jgi:pimeloyl-ACP methyl ester carboxylesterase
LIFLLASSARAQMCDRIMVQDSTLNNLQHPPGYVCCEPGTLGEFRKQGSGPRTMILIPGLGFGSGIFDEFMLTHEADFTMYAVTLPGFAGTPAPPMPPEGTSYGELTWMRGAYEALVKRIQAEGLRNLVVVGHWLGGTQIALWLAMDHPEWVSGVIIVSGSTRFTPTDTTRMPYHPTLDFRVKGIDQYLAPRWFKTVTRETWDDNNYLPIDYAVHPVRGLRLWREAARPTLPVWVRYLNEFFAQDVSLDLGRLEVPTLVLKPGLEDLYYDAGQNYMEAFCHLGWDGAALTNPRIEISTIPRSRICLWYDQPELFDEAVENFVARLGR